MVLRLVVMFLLIRNHGRDCSLRVQVLALQGYQLLFHVLKDSPLYRNGRRSDCMLSGKSGDCTEK